MSIIKQNIIANFGGNVWTGLMGLVFVPLYIHFMGIEAYGLVGIFAGLQAIFALLDMGLSNTLNREMARLSIQNDKSQVMRDLVRTLEIPYWAVGLLIAGIVILAAPFIAFRWVNVQELSPQTVQTAVMIMGFSIAFQWPLTFYSGGLMGLQRQVLLNTVNALMATFRAIGAVLVLWLISPTVEAFFSWQIVISLCHTSLMAFFLWRSLPGSPGKPRFQHELFLMIWRFAAGVTGITVLATLLTQADKIILSRMLSMEMFGYYTLAHVMAMTLYRFIGPVFSAVYPRFTNLVALQKEQELKTLYHMSAQLVSVLVLPTAIVVALFSKEILLLWTQNPMTAGKSYLLVSILVIGTALNGIMNIPYALQLASGWTRLAFWVNLISVLVLVPLMIFLAKYFGALGAASVWVILNGGYVLFAVQIMHRRLLPTEKWRWYLQDVGLPLGASFLVAGLFRITVSPPPNDIMAFAYLFFVSAITLSVSAAAAQTTRNWVQTKFSTWRNFHAVKS